MDKIITKSKEMFEIEKNLGKALDSVNSKKLNDKKEKETPITFIDLFAGAGGFSEGFLQAEFEGKIFDFLLASDINENCELTHRVRYNYQLGIDAEFIKQDITEPDFLENLLHKLNGKKVDVICGGPPCQSFSLAGRRKKFDKKDDLFSHYLEVIRHLKPKYFVMENVKGILTKEKGKIKDLILREIKAILDPKEFKRLLTFITHLSNSHNNKFILECYYLRLQFEKEDTVKIEKLKSEYIRALEKRFKILLPKLVDYKTSKTDKDVNTIRHGFNLLKRNHELATIRKSLINEKAHCNIDNDLFVNDINSFLEQIEPRQIVLKVYNSIRKLPHQEKLESDIQQILKALEIFISTIDECIHDIEEIAIKSNKQNELESILEKLRLYNIEEPFVALASNYGVPQNRERVLFIGCRKDQELIKEIKPTVDTNERVTVFEALYDLDFLDVNEEQTKYQEIDLELLYNGTAEKMGALLQKRSIQGARNKQYGRKYAEWSRKGRLLNRFNDIKRPVYVKSFEDLGNSVRQIVANLHNHKTSNQNEEVIKRLEVILKYGNYESAKEKLSKLGLGSEKRSYQVLKPELQSPTIMTMPDDYIHYRVPRALTVREMARLQSFDDSFVFQGKRSTGGDKRKSEVPQYTLVGNAIPPLMARAIAIEILKNIK